MYKPRLNCNRLRAAEGVRRIAAGLALMFIGLAAAPCAAQVEARIRRVGLFGGGLPMVRCGNWSFVEVELRYAGVEPFDGELRIDQLDGDGDVVTSVLPAPLLPSAEWRSFEVYFVPHDVNRSPNISVRLFDQVGRLVRVRTDGNPAAAELVSDTLTETPAEQFLVLDLTMPRKLPHAAALDSNRRFAFEVLSGRSVRPLSPRELPARWQGLEPVDAVVWDDADPSGLSPQQVEALVGWIRHGGRLLITASANWQALAGSPLAAALPVEITGAGAATEAQEFIDIVRKRNEEYANLLERQYNRKPITRCEVKPRADALPIPADCANAQIAYRRFLGRGCVTFIGASLRELLPPPRMDTAAEEEEFSLTGPPDSPAHEAFVNVACEDLVARNFLALPPVRKEEISTFLRDPIDLFDYVRGSIAFGTSTATYLLFAILFAIAYSLAATLGSYLWLRRRNWLHHCWTAFALVSIVGSVLGTVMVWTLRGVRTKLWQTTIVDAQAGGDEAQACCLLGVKTPAHMRLDLRMPVGDAADEEMLTFAPLRHMPDVTALLGPESVFVAPENYQSVLAGSMLEGVEIRATLKEFQSSWAGSLGGTLDGKLVADEKNEFGQGSYIRNRLGVTLRDCYLLETRDEVAAKGFEVNCFRLGDIRPVDEGGAVEDEQVRQLLYFEPGKNPGDPPLRIRTLPKLDKASRWWHQQLLGAALTTLQRGTPAEQQARLSADSEYVAVLLLSVFGLLESEQPNQPLALRRSFGRPLECVFHLTERTAILVGYTQEPAPAVLQVNRADLSPAKARTIYRFVIPVERPKRRSTEGETRS